MEVALLTIILVPGNNTVVFIFALSVSFLALCIAMMVMCRREQHCCEFTLPRTEDFAGGPLEFFSRQAFFIDPQHHNAMMHSLRRPQHSSQLFVIGNQSNYQMAAPPPSYESVRKKDQQKQIHRTIGHRFSLSDCPAEHPPTYEETCRQSLDISPADLQSLDVQLSMQTQHPSSDLNGDTNNQTHPSTVL